MYDGEHSTTRSAPCRAWLGPALEGARQAVEWKFDWLAEPSGSSSELDPQNRLEDPPEVTTLPCGNNFNFNLTKLNRNLKQTRKIFHKFKIDLDNNEIPLLSSYEKDYELNFSIKTLKKFSKYKKIILDD